MSTLIRTTLASFSTTGLAAPVESVLLGDDATAADMIRRGIAATLEAFSYLLMGNAASTKKFAARLALAGTPQTLDLTSLAAAGAVRDGTSTNFSVAHTLMYWNLGSGTKTLTVGAAGSNPFTGPLGGSSPTIAVSAGMLVVLQNPLAAGWAIDGTHKALKFDPGADTFDAIFALAGIGT